MLTSWVRGSVPKIIGYITNINLKTAYFKEICQLVDHGVEVLMYRILVLIIIIKIIIRHESSLARPVSDCILVLM